MTSLSIACLVIVLPVLFGIIKPELLSKDFLLVSMYVGVSHKFSAAIDINIAANDISSTVFIIQC